MAYSPWNKCNIWDIEMGVARYVQEKLKNNNHIFHECYKAKSGWASNVIYFESHLEDSNLLETTSIINIIGKGLMKNSLSTKYMFIVY